MYAKNEVKQANFGGFWKEIDPSKQAKDRSDWPDSNFPPKAVQIGPVSARFLVLIWLRLFSDGVSLDNRVVR